MQELLTTIDWMELVQTVWTVVLLPLFAWVGKEIQAWAKVRKIEKYTEMLINATEKVIKEMYQTVVTRIKDTDEWTPEKQAEIKDIAKTKIIQSITTEGYKILKAANSDFDLWLDSLIEAAVFDEKVYL